MNPYTSFRDLRGVGRSFYIDIVTAPTPPNLSKKKRGEIKAQLSSAKKLDENQINKIKKELEENLKSKIKLDYLYDETLIGGLVMKVGSTMVDTSIKNKLKQIEKGMIEA